jgi:hypothetical protein
MRATRRIMLAVCAAAAALSTAGCQDDDSQALSFPCDAPTALPDGLPASVLLLTNDRKLLNVNPATAAAIGNPVAITGIPASEQLLGIDFRPADSVLIAVTRNGTAGALYSINPTTGAATALTTSTPLTLTGTSFGVDFNPVPGALRIVSDAEENLRLTFPTPTSYAVNVDTGLSPAATVVAAAYSNNFAGTPVTTLYNLDAGSGSLLTQGGVDSVNNPNGGGLATVGSLGVVFNDQAGFDIDGVTGTALAVLNVQGANASRLYTVDLGSGAATCLGAVPALPAGTTATDLAIPVPAPAQAFGLLAGNRLVSFTPNASGIGSVSAPVNITGLGSGEEVVGIDIRPANGALIALAFNAASGAGALYDVAPASGAATAIPANSGSAALTFASGTTAFGVDFNPVPGALRILTNTGENYRLAFPAGSPGYTVNVDGAVNPASSVTSGAGYTQNYAGTTATRLYAVDSNDNTLRLQSPPNDGTQQVIGPLGVTATDGASGFDIVGGAGVRAAGATDAGINIGNAVSFLALNAGGSTTLYRLNLATGAATQIGTSPVGGAAPVLLRGMTVLGRNP